MWGEIEPAEKTLQSPCETEEPEGRLQTGDGTGPGDGPGDGTGPADTQVGGLSQSGSVELMIEAVVVSGSPVKSQQIGDEELSPDQRREELLLQYRRRPLVFLERYHTHLQPQHLSAFDHVSSDPRAQHYGAEVRRRAAGQADRTRVRNQRYAALRALQKEGQYFSEEQMRTREPLLYEHYIGRFLTDDQVLERSQDAMLDGAGGGVGGGLANLLLNSYQERLIQNRLQEEQDREDGGQEEDEEDDDVQQEDREPSAEEKALLREEFISQMHQRFLDGKDRDFNYREVDENPDYDNLDIVSRDAEDKYFDEDEEEEEEDMTE